MLEIAEILLLTAVVLLLTAIFSAVFAVLVRTLLDQKKETRLSILEDEVERLIKTFAGTRGQQVRQEKNERIQAAMMEAAALFQAGKKPEEIAKELLPKYPDITMDLFLKLQKGKLF